MTYVPPHIRQQYPNLPHSAHVNIYAALPVGPPPAVTSQADYGAIAYDSSTGQFGWSWGYANVEEAKRRAMRAVWKP